MPEGHGYPSRTHPMFYNRRSSVVPSRVLHYKKLSCLIPCFVMGEAWLQPKKTMGAGSWVGTFRKCLGKGRGEGGAGQAWQLRGHISEMLPPWHTSDFEPCMHKYLQQPLPKPLEKKPMKRKEKWSCIKDGKNKKRKESCVKDGHWEKQVDFKQTLLHKCGQTKKWSKSQIDWGHKNILNLASQYSKRFVKVFFI